MPDFDNINDVLQMLSDAQEAEFDNRIRVRNVTNFLEKDDGQWEPGVINQMTGRPRYTFDKCNPVVDSIAGEMEQAEFAIKVRPEGGEATEDSAKIFDGIIRNIQSMSNAPHVFNSAGRKMVAAGFDAWRVTHDWGDTDSFEQDLFIRKIANAVDRVWFDPGAEMQDMSDAGWCFVLQALTKDEYEERFPEGSGNSVGDSRTDDVYFYKADHVIVGEFLYKEQVARELVLMSNNAVYEADEDFEKVKDELAADGVTEVRRRKRESHIVKSRLFDGKDWLSESKETVFRLLPVVPTYANFQISENKVIYRGAVNKLMDAQRVYNYAQSRAIEEGALAPRGKYWMTRQQAQSDIQTLQTMNTNADPVQTYTHVDGQPAPFWQGGAQINAGLQQTASDMSGNIIESSGVFAANQGNAPDQSGFAIELQQQKGDNSTVKYFKSQEIAICQTAKILVDAIPRVYDTKRTVRMLGEDGVSRMETINDDIFDSESGSMVSVNDVRKGKYDVVCDVGPAFRSRQQETARAFLEAAGIDPSLLTFAKDVWLKNLNAPGFDIIADRARKQLLEAGAIPDDQMTEKEKERAQQLILQAQAEAEAQGPDPIQAAILEQTQANTADVISRANERTAKTQIAAEKVALQAQDQEFKEVKFSKELDQTAFDQLMAQQQQFMEQQKQAMDQNVAVIDALNTQAETLKTLREAMGVETIVGPHNTEAYIQQSEIVGDSQEAMTTNLETADIVDTSVDNSPVR